MNYRNLNQSEIELLSKQNCTAEDWSKVTLSEEPSDCADRPGRCTQGVREDLKYVSGASFSGEVRLGRFSKSFTLPGGVMKHSGIRNASLHNVCIGDDCCIENISNYIANYNIGDNALIENVDIIYVDGESAFGNGTEVSVMNELGGREVLICDKLSAQMAYMMALYRHYPKLCETMRRLVTHYAEKHSSRFGTVGNNVTIRNTGTIEAVRIGDYCTVSGAGVLRDGSINSTEDAPVFIGHGVVAKHFIISSGSSVEDNTTITNCFIGQACRLGHGYSAENSLFFSNCQGENGEACAIFAGPFTVTHHKSTLLIAGMFSFMNAGSGSNQSNHMYKLGPIHQGILERGAKTSSDSYILWPSRVGAFSLVMGRHVTHSDTSNLPFSYIIEQNNTTYLVPGVNIKSVGTIRDAQKWPMRDKRKGNKLDFINYNLLSPYTIQKMLKGLQTLSNLQYASGMLTDEYSFHSIKIKNSALRKGIGYYNTGITKFLGNSVIKRLEGRTFASNEEIRQAFVPDTGIGTGEWVDMSGLIAPKSEVLRLISDIENGRIQSLREIGDAFGEMFSNYYTYEWTWVYGHLQSYFGFSPETITASEVIEIVNRWKEAVVGLDKMLYEDAKKEFSLASMTGFGADGTKEEKEQDFEQVRGVFESNPFVHAVLNHIEVKSKLGDELISRMMQVR